MNLRAFAVSEKKVKCQSLNNPTDPSRLHIRINLGYRYRRIDTKVELKAPRSWYGPNSVRVTNAPRG